MTDGRNYGKWARFHALNEGRLLTGFDVAGPQPLTTGPQDNWTGEEAPETEVTSEADEVDETLIETLDPTLDALLGPFGRTVG